ncbi:CTD small phosphatase-like protein 2 isoform X2 [Phalaenopsis equestris]|nr:CTD small phosphatase-like protein 2 isoform X2 [Phalaenopsis equestris]
MLKFMFSSPDSPSFGGMESMLAPCPGNIETIFSPCFEQNDENFKAISSNDSVGDKQPPLPHLITDEVDEDCCTFSEFQTCNGFDFYFSDNFLALPVDGGIGFNDILNIPSPDNELLNSDALLDLEERPIYFPLLDERSENYGLCDDKSAGKHMDGDDSCLYLAIHQLKSPDQDAQMRCFTSDFEETACFNLQLTANKLSNLPVSRTEAVKRKPITLVLDLDETLVHSTLEHCEDADFSFPVFFNMKQHTVYVRRRPYLQMFLERVAQIFRVVIFTASQSIYAEKLLNILDPERKLISQCFYRESCVFSDGSYTKDLSILGVDLAKVIIIDNSPQVFRLQVDNGIPIKSWFDDPADQALTSLLPFLESLAYVDDVRPLIANIFGSREEQKVVLI